MNDLPNRDDEIYQEIEALEDFEFTNCIAFEMAIRNKEVKSIKKKINKLQIKLAKEYLLIREDDNNQLNITFDRIYEEWIEYQNDKFDDEEDKVEPDYQKYILSKNATYLKIVDYINILLNKYWIRHIYENDILSYSLRPNKNDVAIGEIRNLFELEKRLREQQIIGYCDKITVNDKGEIIKDTNNLLETNSNLELNLNRLYPSIDLLRTLTIPDKYNKNTSLSLNLNLPKDELIAYITKLKDEFDNDNSIIKTPLELLGEDLEPSTNKKINKSLIADKFFIYDYVTARLEQIKQMNEDIIQEYEENIQEIKNFNNGRDRTIQLRELKKELDENIINTKVEDIFKEIEDYKPATAKRYYYDMKPFIDDLKYKELITGTIQ